MKKTKLLLIVASALSSALMLCTACNDNPVPEKPVEILLNYETYNLDLHEKIQLTATTENTDKAVTWSSSEPGVATVDENGLVTSVKVGKTTVTATVGDVTATCEITVTNSGAAPVLVLDYDKIGVNKNAEITVNASVKYKSETVGEAIEYNWALTEGADADVISLTPAANSASAVIKGVEYGETSFDVSAVVWGTPLKQTVAVKVCNTDITFEVKGYEPDEGGYKTSLALVKTGTYETSSTPDIVVKNKGEVVSDAQISWVADKDGIVSVKNGVISAVGAGDVTLVGNYDNNTVKLFVTVVRPEITLSKTTVETSKSILTLADGDAVEGTVSSVRIGDDETNLFDKVEDEAICLKSALLPKAATKLGEDKEITVETDRAIYVIPADIYTQVIRTKDELASWGDLAKAANDNAKIWDGYFVLGNDIDFEGETYNSFINYSTTGTVTGEEGGFAGVFDGKGHIIDDIVINPSACGGFVGLMYVKGDAHGVIKNVAFTNAVSEGYGGFIVSAGGGEVSNVYVSLNMLKGGNDIDVSGVFFSRDMVGWSARVTNCFVEIKQLGADVTSNTTYAIGSKHRRTGSIRGVYAVGYDNAFRELSDAVWDEPADVYGAYSSWNDFFDADIDFSTWDTDFWKVVDGVPYPKNLDESLIPEIKLTNLQATVTATNRISGAAVDLAGKKVTLKGLYGTHEATVTDGRISVSNIIKGSYIAAVDGCATTTLTVADEELNLSFIYNGQRLDTPINDVDYTFWWNETVTMTKGEMDLPEQYGQYQVKLGSRRQNHVITKGSYDNVVVEAMFSSTYGAYANTTGIMLKFEDNKGILLGFQNQDDYLKLTYRTDNESYKFGMDDTLTGWIGDNGELEGCKPMKQAWVDKFNTALGLKVTMVRNGNALLTYVDDTLVNVYALPEEYASKKCNVGFFSNWGGCDIPFAVSNQLPDCEHEITVTGIDGLTHGAITLNKTSGWKMGDAIVLNIAPAQGYKLKNLTVDGRNVTSNVKDGKLALGYATEDLSYEISASFIADKDNYDVTFTYDTEKYNADGLVITLKKGEESKTVTLGDSATITGLAVGEWAATAEFGGMTVSLGNFDIQVDEYYVDLAGVFGNAVKAIDFENNKFVYATGSQQYVTLNLKNISAGDAFFVFTLKFDKDVMAAGKNWNCFGIGLGIGNNNYIAPLMYSSNPDAGGDYQKAYLYEEPSWAGSTGYLADNINNAITNGDELIFVWAYNAATGSMDLYAGTTAETLSKIGTLYGGKIDKNATITSITLCDPWGGSVKSDIQILSFDYKTSLPAQVSVTGIDSLENGTAALTKESYKVSDEIVLKVTPADGYKAVKVLVNGEDKISLLKEDGTLLLGSAKGSNEYEIEIVFGEPISITTDVSAIKKGAEIDLNGKIVTLEGANGKYECTVKNGQISVDEIFKGVYTAKFEGYIDVKLTLDSADVPEIVFEYDLFSGSGGYNLANQNKENASVFIGQQQHNYVLTNDKYDDVSVTASFKASNGSYKAFSGIQLVFDNGNGVMLILECSEETAVGSKTKLSFGTDCWGAKYAISGNALTGWTDVKNPLTAEMAAAFDGDGLEITVVRTGNAVQVIYGEEVLYVLHIDASYATEKCRVSFYSEWGECTIPFEISEDVQLSEDNKNLSVQLSGGDSLENGAVALGAASYDLGDAIVLNITPADGYKVKKITVNEVDMTDKVVDNKLLVGAAIKGENKYAVTATFIEDKPAYDVTFSYDTAKYDADGLVITLKKGEETNTVTLGDSATITGLAVGEWAATAEFGGMTVSLGNFNIIIDEYFVDLGKVFGNSGAITGADFVNNTFDYKMFVKSNEDFQPAFMTGVSGIDAGNAYFMTKISLDNASKEVIKGSSAWCVVRLFMQVGDSRQEIMLAYHNGENAFRFIQLPGWTMQDLSAEQKTAYDSGDGLYVVWGYNAEAGSMDIYAGTAKDNVAKVGSFREGAFPTNGTVSAIGFGDGLWGNPDFSVKVELNYSTTLNGALGITE